MVKVTVYISCYNYEKYVKKAIDSVLNQDYDDYEIFIFDDGSTDNSREVIKNYEGIDYVRVVFQENMGLLKTANKVVKIANGEYIVRLDADDYWDKDFLKELMREIEEDKSIDLIYADYHEVDEQDEIIRRVKRKKIGQEVKLLDLPAHGACTIIKKSVLDDIGGYDESILCQDGYFLWLEVIDNYKLFNVNKPLFYYRKHSRSVTTSSSKLLKARRDIKQKFVNKKYPDKKSLLIVPIRSKNVVKDMYWTEIENGNIYLDYILNNLIKLNMDVVIVSEDDIILDYFNNNSKFKTIRRPKDLAKKGVLVDKTILYVLDELKEDYDNVGVYFSTSPLVTYHNINEAFNTQVIFNTDSVVSVKENVSNFYSHHEYGLKPLFDKHNKIIEERDFLYEETGGLIIYKRENIKNSLLLGKKVGHVVLSEFESLDIDDKFSFWLVIQVMSKKKELKSIDNRRIVRGY